ncbi:MAG: winged helix-turn-helix domain-containing protein [Acidobacteriia bacterium]|nr:winged helix-turn-helix domain-containing protein [Terriglobia bacterium]
MSAPAQERRYARFGPFEVDLQSGELRTNARKIRLQEKPFQILAVLLERPGEVVTREEIRKKLWPADTFVDFEHGINVAVKKLREALDDDAENPHFIETLPRHGYRFIAPMELEGARETARNGGVNGTSLSGWSAKAAQTRTVVRLIALPFRVLKGDEVTDFLAYSLPDAISSSLSGVDTLILRSSLVAARFEGPVDPKRIAAEAEVDAILTGSVMRAGDQIRVTCQLVEAPGGTMIWSETVTSSMQDLFRIQDELSARVVHSLTLPLGERERSILRRDVPASAKAYEFYLRANQIGAVRTLENMRLARDLYLQCLADDANYAPAWARLGRVTRFIEKFGEDPDENLQRADAAFQRAFALNPDLAMAHNLYTAIECDQGRAPQAMVRLLNRASFRRNDPDLFAGLVQACRYSGELKASVAAHQCARHLDPHIVTSVAHTYFLLGDYQKTLDWYGTKGGFYLDCAALVMLGEKKAALAKLREREQSGGATGSVRAIMESLRAYLEGDFNACRRTIEVAEPLTRRDAESLFYTARHLARIN